MVGGFVMVVGGCGDWLWLVDVVMPLVVVKMMVGECGDDGGLWLW